MKMHSNHFVLPTEDLTLANPLFVDTVVVNKKINDDSYEMPFTLPLTPPLERTSGLERRAKSGGDRKQRRIQVRIEKIGHDKLNSPAKSRIILRIPPRLKKLRFGTSSATQSVPPPTSPEAFSAMEIEYVRSHVHTDISPQISALGNHNTVEMEVDAPLAGSNALFPMEIEQGHQAVGRREISSMESRTSKLRSVISASYLSLDKLSLSDESDDDESVMISNHGLATPPPPPFPFAFVESSNRDYLPYRHPQSFPIYNYT